MARKKGNYGIGAARKGTTKIASYEEKGGFNSAGHKRAGNPKYMDGRGEQQSGMNPQYAGGTNPMDSGMTPS
jgi:hypothetical protein